MGDVEAAILAHLREERNEVVLPSGLVEALKTYLATTFSVVEVPKDLPATTEEWIAAAGEAFMEKYEKKLPDSLEMRLRRWLTGRGPSGPGVGAAAGSPPPSTPLGAVEGGAAAGQVARLAVDLGVTPAAVQDSLDEISVTGHTQAKAFSDARAQGMLPTRIYALSVSLETGRVHPPSELVGMVYGGDPRATALVKDLRKARIPLLSTALEEKRLATVIAHLNGLMRDLAAHNMMQEAALLSGWFQEWTQMFSGDEKLAVAYLVEYFRVYPGRGLPTAFDYGIMFRVEKSHGAGGTKELAELADALKEAKALKGKVNNLEEQLASQKKKLEGQARAIEAVQRRNGGGDGARNGGGIVCHNCGEKGHIARDCPRKKQGADEKEEE